MKAFKFLFVLLLSAGFLTGCFEDKDTSYQGPTLVAFSPRLGTANTYTQPVTVPATGNSNIVVKVHLVGPHQSSDTTVNFEVSGTATSGSQYTISGNSTTIPANSSFGDINITALGAGLTPGQSRTIVLTLTGGTFAVSENYKTYTITLTKAAS